MMSQVQPPGFPTSIRYDSSAEPLLQLAAREIARYIYLRTGWLPPVDVGSGGDGCLWVGLDATAMTPQAFKITTGADGGGAIVGGSPIGALYGAYRFAELLGARFYLHGDVVPDPHTPCQFPVGEESGQPLFELRGLNPWGSHAEGLDLWNEDDWKSLIAQMVKMRMNFVGIHGYPEPPPHLDWHVYSAEPVVWVGLEQDVNEDGSVRSGYTASFFSTMRSGWWGFEAKPTSNYSFGASRLFERDDWGSDIMRGLEAEPTDPAQQLEVFNRAGRMFGGAFGFARSLGVKTALGTETPLIVPKALSARLQAEGRDSGDPDVVAEIYRGTFQRLSLAHALDYYWIWTPEAWTWRGATDAMVEATVSDVQIALQAAEDVKAPFKLATAGWVLGPPQDRTLFHKRLPRDVAVAEIARMIGRWPIDPGFGAIEGRDRWAIPWLEDDPCLTSPQLWVGRMRKDASDALRYGCTGLMGLHWRTRILAPNAAALAQAAWKQHDWLRSPQDTLEGALGGAHRDLPPYQIEDLDPVHQTYRLDVAGYRIRVPSGPLRVTLRFLEPALENAGERKFDVLVQGDLRIAALDCVAEAGVRKPIVRVVEDVRPTDGVLEIRFESRSALPVISAIEIEGAGFVKRVNCGGPAIDGYDADWPDPANAPDRHAESLDFYLDWARAEFGGRIAEEAAQIFAQLDGRFPVASDWLRGAGGVIADKRAWNEVEAEFAFVDAFERLASNVLGPGETERFEYWRDIFRYARAQARTRCALGAMEAALKFAETTPSTSAGDAAAVSFKGLLEAIEDAYRALLASVSTPGCIGNVLNWEGHIWTDLVDAPAARLAKILGGELPANLRPDRRYAGPARLIVPTARSLYRAGEKLSLRPIVLDEDDARGVTLHVRGLGAGGEFRQAQFQHLGRGVWSLEIECAEFGPACEYYVEAETSDGARLLFPPGAPERLQTTASLAL